MSGEAQHLPIASPPHLPGYCPRVWCSVCGKAAAKSETYVKCQDQTSCNNVCHLHCLGDETRFSCDQTQSLRTQLNIAEPVVYLTDTSDNELEVTESHDTGTHTEEDTDHLQQLSKEDLIDTVLQLQKEVATSHNIIKS